MVDATTVPTVMLDAPIFAAVILDAFNVPVTLALEVVIPVAATTAPDKLKLPPVMIVAIKAPAVMLDAPIFATVTVVAFNVPVVIPKVIFALAVVIPVAATTAPDKLKLPPVIVLATTVPTVAALAPMFADVTVLALSVPVVIPDDTIALPTTCKFVLGLVVPIPKLPPLRIMLSLKEINPLPARSNAIPVELETNPEPL
jgi:hypothetical protein